MLAYIRLNEYIGSMLDPDLLFEALSDETRRRVVALLLTRGELCVCDLFGVLDLPQPKVSRHLAVLRESGVLSTRKKGTWVYYRLNPNMPLWAAQILSGMADGVARTQPYQADQQAAMACCGVAGSCDGSLRAVNAK